MADNPWPGGITEQTWWFGEQCVAMGGVSGGIYADKPGFHNTVVNNLAKYPNNYSIALPILKVGPRDKARAFDWTFPEAKTKNYFRINQYSARMDVASRARDPRLRGLYEWFGTRDGANIGWNIWKNVFSSSDDTHDWHMHFSWITAYLLDWAGPQGVISVLRGETLQAYLARGGKLIGQSGTGETGDMDFNQSQQLYGVFNLAETVPLDTDEKPDGTGALKDFPVPLTKRFNALEKKVDAIAAQVAKPVEVALTADQLVILAREVAKLVKSDVLRPLADAAQAEATTLDVAAGQ